MSSRPVIIGVAGGSGSGKTTVVRRMVTALGTGQVSVLDQDRNYFDHPNLRLEDRADLNLLRGTPHSPAGSCQPSGRSCCASAGPHEPGT